MKTMQMICAGCEQPINLYEQVNNDIDKVSIHPQNPRVLKIHNCGKTLEDRRLELEKEAIKITHSIGLIRIEKDNFIKRIFIRPVLNIRRRI